MGWLFKFLIVYKKKNVYSITPGILWNYYKDEVNDDANENNDAGNYRRNNNKTTTIKSFEYKTKIITGTPANTNRLDTEVAVPLKYLSNFWRSLVLPLFKCGIGLICHGQEICVISEMLVNPNPNPPAQEADVTQTKGATFNITKHYALVVTLSINDNKFLENLKKKFKRTISWNKYQSEIQHSLKHEFRLYDWSNIYEF